MTNAFAIHLTDGALVAELRRLAGCERAATAELIAHLAVVDERRLHLPAGFSSLFVYCVEVLKLSEHETYNRIEAARAARRFPAILALLADGSVSLTAVRLLAPHLTPENHSDLLEEATGKRIEAVKELVARIAPRPDVASSIRKVTPAKPAADPAGPNALSEGSLFEPEEGGTAGDAEERPVAGPATASPQSPAAAASPASPAPPTRPAKLAPLAPDSYEFRFTGRRATRDKFRYAQALLRDALPSGDMGEIFDRALDLLIEELERSKFAGKPKPRAPRPTGPQSRKVSAGVRRVVWRRDGGQCAFIGDDGRRCDARAHLQFHHVKPYGASGPPTAENISLRCAAHNRYEATQYYGPIWAARGEGVVEEGRAAYGLAAAGFAAVSAPTHVTRFKTSWGG